MLTFLLILFTSVERVSPTCFEAINSTEHFAIIESSSMIAQRACEYNCEKSSKCTHISVRPLNSAVHCTLLGEPIKSETCIVPTLIYRKVDKDCKDRTNVTAEYGSDPCVRETFAVGVNTNPICPFKQGTDYVVRVVLEDGSRRTLDNDANNRIVYSPTMRMWQYRYSTETGNLLVQFVAGVCAIADGSKCPCSPLGPVDTGSKVANPVLINKLGACEKAAWSIWMIWDKKSGAVYQRPTKSAESRLACQAGEWFLYEGDRPYGILTLKASCV